MFCSLVEIQLAKPYPKFSSSFARLCEISHSNYNIVVFMVDS